MSAIVTLTINPAVDVSTSVEEVVPVYKLRCKAAALYPGGGGINVARVVRRLDGDVKAIYTVGGETGNLLKTLTEREDIPSVTIATSQPTRQDFTVWELRSSNEYRFVFPGAPLEQGEWQQCLDTLEALSPPPQFFVASGSLSPDVPHDFYARVARIAKKAGGHLLLDTSGPALADALAEGVYLVKPNLRELTELVGRKLADRQEQIAAAKQLVADGGADVVALTLGAEGALLVTGEETLEAQAPEVCVAGSVGAGDSFLGAMVCELSKGRSIREAFKSGVAAGTAALLSPGTDLCTPEDVIHLSAKVRITVLSMDAAG